MLPAGSSKSKRSVRMRHTSLPGKSAKRVVALNAPASHPLCKMDTPFAKWIPGCKMDTRGIQREDALLPGYDGVDYVAASTAMRALLILSGFLTGSPRLILSTFSMP